jgi:uncharacterized membrane protein
MVTAAKAVSQVATHMTIAFAITYWLTGSMAFGGLVAVLEPIINVMLLPLHEKMWTAIRRTSKEKATIYMMLAAQKCSQTGMHMAVAFSVMYWATGSVAFGGLIAALEPVCNVAVLPFHDKVWEKIRMKADNNANYRFAAA